MLRADPREVDPLVDFVEKRVLIRAGWWGVLYFPGFPLFFRGALSRDQGKGWAMIFSERKKQDNGGRRLEKDRRIYSYTEHYPEQRKEEDRRGGLDRRDDARREAMPQA